jgi:hypothetical protein
MGIRGPRTRPEHRQRGAQSPEQDLYPRIVGIREGETELRDRNSATIVNSTADRRTGARNGRPRNESVGNGEGGREWPKSHSRSAPGCPGSPRPPGLHFRRSLGNGPDRCASDDGGDAIASAFTAFLSSWKSVIFDTQGVGWTLCVPHRAIEEVDATN